MSDVTTTPIPMPQSPVVDLRTGYASMEWYRFWNQPELQSVNYPGKVSTSDDVPEGLANLYFTNIRAQSAVASILQSTPTITFTYLAGSAIEASLNVIPDSGVGTALLKITRDSYGRVSGTQSSTTTDLAEGSNLYFTNQRADNAIGAAIAAGTQEGITVTYNSGVPSLDFVINPTEFASKPAVVYASTSALPSNTYNNGSSGVGATLTGTTNGPLVIDGVTLVVGNLGERVLVAAESSSANNGWYTITQIGTVAVSPYILTRATESDQGSEIGPGYLTGVEAPTGFTPGTNNGKLFISVAPTPFVVGTSAISFSIVGITYSPGTGLTLTGTQFSVTNTAVTPSSYGDTTHVATFTVNAQGQLTLAGSSAIAFPVTSVFGRTGAVVAAANDYTFAQLASKPTTLAGYGITDALSNTLPSFRNLLINATGVINQRVYVSGTATTSSNQYTVDRWKVQTSGQSLSWTASAGISTFTAPVGGVAQVVEGGSIQGGTYTLSWIGTATATVNGSAVSNGANVILTGNANATVVFSSGTFSLPQLEKGAAATGFDFRPIGLEMQSCLRYFENIYGSFLTGVATSTGAITFSTMFQVAKPTTPIYKLLQTSVSADSFNLNVGGSWVSASGMSMSSAGGDMRGVSFNLNGLSGLTVSSIAFFNMTGAVIFTASCEL